MKKLILLLLTTLVCWLAACFVTLGGDHFGYWGNLLWKLEQAVHMDEELIVLSCYLLFSVAISMHVEAFRFKARYRDRFIYPQLGILYSVVALLAGSMLRHLFHDPFEDWFHLAYTVVSCVGFSVIFYAKFKRILRREPCT